MAFLDSAYQGFASGDAENDAWALRFLVREHPEIPLLLAQSFAKNFGLYGERCGTLSVVCRGRNNQQEKEIVLSQLKGIIRPMYSSPPRHGSDIVKTILGDPQLTAQYHEECRSMAERIQIHATRVGGGIAQGGFDAGLVARGAADWHVCLYGNVAGHVRSAHVARARDLLDPGRARQFGGPERGQCRVRGPGDPRRDE